jgi:hypothetical protein
MAKKSVATLKTGDSASYTKVVKMTKNKRSGGLMFEEKIVNKEHVEDFFKKS